MVVVLRPCLIVPRTHHYHLPAVVVDKRCVCTYDVYMHTYTHTYTHTHAHRGHSNIIIILQVVDILLAKNSNYEHRNVSDYTPLSLAASGGYVAIIKSLLKAGAEINSR